MEVWFYHLERRPLAEVLPILAGKALERGWRVVVQGADAARLKTLDDQLWTDRAECFLPHALADDPRAARQPLVLTSGDDNPNGSAVRMYVAGAQVALSPDEAGYERVMLLFDGRDEAELDAARKQWTRLKGAGFALAYWQQDESGRWDRKMEVRPAGGA